MLKWDVYGRNDEPLRLPKAFTVMIVCLYAGAFSFVAYLWYSLIVFLVHNKQTFIYWMMA